MSVDWRGWPSHGEISHWPAYEARGEGEEAGPVSVTRCGQMRRPPTLSLIRAQSAPGLWWDRLNIQGDILPRQTLPTDWINDLNGSQLKAISQLVFCEEL